MAKKTTDKKKKEYKNSIVDYIDGLTINKKQWNSYTEAEQKGFLVFITNRWLSMDMDLIELINYLQQYTVGQLNQKEVYNLYKGILPKRKLYIRYIKGAEQDKYNDELIEYLSLYYEISKTEAKSHLDILFRDMGGISHLKEILSKYGLDEKKINKLIKIK